MIEIRDVMKAVEPIRKRAQLAIARGVMRLVSDDAGIQQCQAEALEGDVRDKAERFQNYGFTSVPFSGSECIATAVGGTTSHTVIIVCDDRRYRLKNMAEGEVAIYDDQQQVIQLMRDGIKISTDKPVTVNATDITVTSEGNTTITVAGNAIVTAEGSASVIAASVARIEGADVQIHAIASLKLDAGGYGETWTPGGRSTWTQGTSTTNAGAPSPPEHP